MRLLAAALCFATSATRAQAQAEPAPADANATDPATWTDDWGDVGALEVANGDVKPMTAADTYYAEGYPELDRGFNVYTARTARPKSFITLVAHRTNTPLRTEPFYNYLGFDGGMLKVELGVRYGLFEGLDMGVARVNGTVEAFDTYELDARYQLLRQSEHFANVAVRGGASWFAQRDQHALKPFGQLLADRVFWNRLLVALGVLYHADSTGPNKKTTATDYSVAVSGVADLRVVGLFAWGVEVVANVAGYGTKYPAITTGPKIITNRHTFSLVIANTQYTTADSIVANTAREPEDLIIGFNITREINL